MWQRSAATRTDALCELLPVSVPSPGECHCAGTRLGIRSRAAGAHEDGGERVSACWRGTSPRQGLAAQAGSQLQLPGVLTESAAGAGCRRAPIR